jgi:hypothetical protein
MDALNALEIVTHELDAELGTGYSERFRSYLEYVQEHDLTCDGAWQESGRTIDTVDSDQDQAQDPRQAHLILLLPPFLQPMRLFWVVVCYNRGVPEPEGAYRVRRGTVPAGGSVPRSTAS